MGKKATREFSGLPFISREEARDAGLKQYFTGIPCDRAGHVAPRYTLSCACVLCLRDANTQWHRRMYRENISLMRSKNRARRHADPIGELIRVSRSRAKKRGMTFSITKADLPLPEHCPCCSRKIIPATGKNRHGGRPESPSIDRIDSRLGYEPGNVAIICWRCNHLKSNAAIDELKKIVKWMESVTKPQPLLSVVA